MAKEKAIVGGHSKIILAIKGIVIIDTYLGLPVNSIVIPTYI